MTTSSNPPAMTGAAPAVPATIASAIAPPRRHRPGASLSQPSLAQQVLAYALLAVGSLLFLVPFYFVVNGSLKDDPSVQAGDFVTPVAHPQWGNYARALAPDKMNFAPALANTVVVTTLVVVGQVLSCSLVGYGFARFRFRGKGILFLLMLSTMMLPAQVTMIPLFVLFRALGMIDTFWPLILPAWFASPFFVFMFRQFFLQVPEELLEAARIDGCGNVRIYAQVMLPLSGGVIAIVAIYTFLGTWNDFLGPLIYLNSPGNRTLAIALSSFKGQYGTSDVNLLMAASVVCMLPCVILFFALQRFFIQSVAQTGGK